jgi:hypothetical protein
MDATLSGEILSATCNPLAKGLRLNSIKERKGNEKVAIFRGGQRACCLVGQESSEVREVRAFVSSL